MEKPNGPWWIAPCLAFVTLMVSLIYDFVQIRHFNEPSAESMKFFFHALVSLLVSPAAIGVIVVALMRLRSKPQKKKPPFEAPGLKFRGVTAGHWSYLKPFDTYRNPLVVEVENQGEKIKNVVARLRFVSEGGTVMTVDPACWLVRDETNKGSVVNISHVLIPKVWEFKRLDWQQIIIASSRLENNVQQICEADMETLIGTLEPNRWYVTIEIFTESWNAELHRFDRDLLVKREITFIVNDADLIVNVTVIPVGRATLLAGDEEG